MFRHADAVERYMHMGEGLGLAGAELKRFIDEQIEIERNQVIADRDERTRAREVNRETEIHEAGRVRAAALEERALENERLDRERRLENERSERERAALLEDRAAEADRETRRQEHELAMRRLELENQGGANGQVAGAMVLGYHSLMNPKMPWTRFCIGFKSLQPVKIGRLKFGRNIFLRC